jgi:RNA polymerase sigma factor (sigma-70 family)
VSNASLDTRPSDPVLERREFLDELYKAYGVELRRFVTLQYGKGPPEPADVVQAAFARLAALGRPQRLSNPRAFLYRTVRNIFIDQRRRMATHQKFALEVVAHEATAPSYEFPAERVLMGEEEWRIIEAVIRSMPERRRQCFLLHRLHGLGYAEIGRRLGISGAGVAKAVEKALEQCELALEAAQQRKEGAPT